MRRIFFIAITILISCLAYAQEDHRIDTLAQSAVTSDLRLESISEKATHLVTKLNSGKIELENRLNYKDISALVPNLHIPEYGSKMTSSIYMRGLGSRIDSPVVGMYVDGINIASKNSFDQDVFDLRSIQMFRGPQGTMFGKNTIGGIISLTTLSPLVYQGTRIELGYGNANTYSVRLSHYKKFSERLGISLGARSQHSDGLYYNEGRDENCGLYDEFSMRFKLEYIGLKDDKTTITAAFNQVNQNGFPYHMPGQAIAYNDPATYSRNNAVVGGHYSRNLGRSVLESNSSYQFLSDEMNMDQDYTTDPYFTLKQAQNEHVIGQELVLKTNTEAWQHLSGLSLGWRHNDMDAPVRFKSVGIDRLILDNANAGISVVFPGEAIKIKEREFEIFSDFKTDNLNLGLYHSTFYSFGDFKAEMGLRLDLEHIMFRYDSRSDIHYLFTATMTDWRDLSTAMKGRDNLTYVEPLPRIALNYQKGNWSSYASVSEGYKAGGFNVQLFSDILQNRMMGDMMKDLGVYLESFNSDYEVSEVISYKPERSWNFEIGTSYTKVEGDWSYKFEAAIYDIEIYNQQLTVFPEKGTGRFMTNAGRSRSFGAELSASAVMGRLSLNANYGHTQARFVRYDNGKADFAGNYVPYVPNNTLSASATWNQNLNGNAFRTLSFNLNLTALGKIYWNEENDIVQPFYSCLAANIRLATKWGSLQLWSKNITDTDYNSFYFKSMGRSFLQSGMPRTYGLRVLIEI